MAQRSLLEFWEISNGNPNGEVVIDCGALSDQAARDRADLLFAEGIGKRCLNWGPAMGSPRIYLRIPPTKRERILHTFPLQAKPGHWGSTHTFETGGLLVSMIVGGKPARSICAKRFRDAVRRAVKIREAEGWDTISLKVLQRRGVYVNEAPLTWRRTDPEAARIEGRA